MSSSASTSRGTAYQKALHGTFQWGIGLKGIFALGEAAIGFALFFMRARMMNRIVLRIGALDLSRNRNDWISMHLRHALADVTGTGRHFAAVYLLSHGLVKLILVIELLRNKLWAYPLLIALLAVFIGYQCYRFTLTHSLAMIALSLFDLAVIALTWMEYREQRRLKMPN